MDPVELNPGDQFTYEGKTYTAKPNRRKTLVTRVYLVNTDQGELQVRGGVELVQQLSASELEIGGDGSGPDA